IRLRRSWSICRSGDDLEDIAIAETSRDRHSREEHLASDMCLAARKELACDSICDDIQIANIKLGPPCDADKLPVVIVGELESVVCFIIGIRDLIRSHRA